MALPSGGEGYLSVWDPQSTTIPYITGNGSLGYAGTVRANNKGRWLSLGDGSVSTSRCAMMWHVAGGRGEARINPLMEGINYANYQWQWLS